MTKLDKIKKMKKHRGREYINDLFEAILETLEEILEELKKK